MTNKLSWLRGGDEGAKFIPEGDWISGAGWFHIVSRKDRYFDLYDVRKEPGSKQCNKKRLSLKACKELAEEIVAGEEEDAEERKVEFEAMRENEQEAHKRILDLHKDIREAANTGKLETLVANEDGILVRPRSREAEVVRVIEEHEQGKIKIIEMDYMPGDFLPPGPENLPKALTMPCAESRTKEKTRGLSIEEKPLKGGIGDDEVISVRKLPPHEQPKSKSREEVQQALNKLMLKNGKNFPNWSEFSNILKENGIDPGDVKQGMIAEAEKWAREHADDKPKQPRMVSLENQPIGTTFKIPGMDFEQGVLLDKNPCSVKVRVTQGCKDREIDWSLGTMVVVVGKVDLEKPSPSGENDRSQAKVEDVPPPEETMEDVMKHASGIEVSLKDAKNLLIALGLKEEVVRSEKMTATKVQTKLNNIEKILKDANEVEGENLKLLKAITDCLSEKGEGSIEVVDETEKEETEQEEEKPTKKGKKSAKAEKEEKTEETKIDENYIINGVEPRFWEPEKAKLVPLTEKLARQFKEMTRFPRDREIQKARMEYFRGEVKNKEFRGAEWVSCRVEETGQTYRMNGKHTSHVCCEFYDNKQDLDGITITLRHFECPTLADAAALFSKFDPKISVRTKQDFLRAYASTIEETSELPDWLITLLTAGLSFAEWEGRGYRSKSVDEQAGVMLGKPEFATWLKDMLGTDRAATKFLARAPVIGAMAKTFDKDSDAATEFWTAIRDECDDPKDAPRRRLNTWLLKHKLGGRSDGEGASEREFYIVCLKAWNAWRTDKKTNLTFDKEKDKETLEVV